MLAETAAMARSRASGSGSLHHQRVVAGAVLEGRADGLGAVEVHVVVGDLAVVVLGGWRTARGSRRSGAEEAVQRLLFGGGTP